MTKKRIFLAIKVQPDFHFIENLEIIRNTFSSEDIRWVNPDNFHITLRFIGDTSVGIIPEINKRLGAASKTHGQFEIQLTGLGIFRSISYPKVLYAGIDDNSGKLTSLKSNVDNHLNDILPPLQESSYSPHLTLGRMKRILDKNTLRQLLNSYQNHSFLKIHVKEIILFESVFISGGVRYEVVCSYQLAYK